MSDETFSFCEPIGCPAAISSVPFASGSCSGRLHFDGDNCTATCLAGHSGGSASFYCNAEGQWAGELDCGPRLEAVGRFEATQFGLLAGVMAPTVSGVGPFAFFLSNTTRLPAGLELSRSNGSVSGRALEAGEFAIAMYVVDGRNLSSRVEESVLVINEALEVDFDVPEHATQDWEASLRAANWSGGTGALRFSASGLPAGMSLDEASGRVSGAASVAGTYELLLTAADEGGGVVERRYELEVATRLELGPTDVGLTQGARFVGPLPNAVGGFGERRFVTTGRLPVGIELDANSGQLSGTALRAGVYPGIDVYVEDSNGAQRFVSSFRLFVAEEFEAGWSGAVEAEDFVYETTLGQELGPAGLAPLVRGGVEPYLFDVSGSVLPPGVRMESDGLLTGRPVVAGSYQVSMVARDNAGAFVQLRTLSIVVYEPLGVSVAGRSSGTDGAAFELVASGSGGKAPVVYDLVWAAVVERGGEAVAGSLKGNDSRTAPAPWRNATAVLAAYGLVFDGEQGRVSGEVRLDDESSSGIVSGERRAAAVLEIEIAVIDGRGERAGSGAAAIELWPGLDVEFALGAEDSPVQMEVGLSYTSRAASVRGGYGSRVFRLAAGRHLPSGLDLNAATGRISGIPLVVNETEEIVLECVDGNAARVASGAVVMAVMPPGDCKTASNGPNGLGCLGGGLCVDDVAFDGRFVCNCTGTGFSGANCDEESLSSARAGGGGSSGVSSGMLAGVVSAVVAIVLAAVLGVYLWKRREASKPVDFEAQLERLHEEGLIQTKKVPVEVRRNRVRMLEELGSGAFGVVSKAMFTSSQGIEFLVAVKVLKSEGFDDADTKRSFLSEAAVMAQLEHEKLEGGGVLFFEQTLAMLILSPPPIPCVVLCGLLGL